MNDDVIVQAVLSRAQHVGIAVQGRVQITTTADNVGWGWRDLVVSWSDDPTCGEIATLAKTIREVCPELVRVVYSHPDAGILANQVNDTISFVSLTGMACPVTQQTVAAVVAAFEQVTP